MPTETTESTLPDWSELASSRWAMACMLLCAVGVVSHQAMRWDWMIDDSAISFAYSRNLMAGEGLVPWPGAERIEAYSNPTWVLLIALFEPFGLSGFVTAKPLAMLLGVGSLFLVWWIARAALPEGRRSIALAAPVVLALNAQFAIWSASGLENSLFIFLLALGVQRVLVEAHRGSGFPWSALIFCALGWTRPEGVLYAAVAGFWVLVFAWRSGRGLLPPLIWATAFWVPYGIGVALRWWYFAWPLPNTYYAKVGTNGTYPMRWESRGWLQVREYCQRLWQGYFLPVYLLGLLGFRGWRGKVALGVSGFGALMLLWPGPTRLAEVWFWPDLPSSPMWLKTRIVVITVVAVGLPFVAMGGKGFRARALCWHLAVVTVFFAVYSNGDWMGAYRWLSLLSPTAAVLFAVGLAELASLAEDWAGADRGEMTWWTLVGLGVAALIPPNLHQTRNHTYFNNNETPAMVKLRGDYTKRFVERSFFEDRVVNLEMDQGAHLWWYPEYVEVDMAGLVDIPMAHHNYKQRKFIDEYVFEEKQPHFAHVHYQWADMSGFKTYTKWNRYIELPRYFDLPGIPILHDGVWARRDMIMAPDWPHSDEAKTSFAQGATLEGLHIPHPQVGEGRSFYFEVGVSTVRRQAGKDFRVLAFVSSGDAVATMELPMAYDALPMSEWGTDVFHGKYAFALPKSFPLGPATLGFVVYGSDGSVLPAQEQEETQALVAVGEAQFEGVIEVVDSAVSDAHAMKVLEGASKLASAGDCEAGWDRWLDAKHAVPKNKSWHQTEEPGMRRRLADCFAKQAAAAPGSASDLLARAHDLDHWSSELAKHGAPVGQRLWEEGLAAREAGDAELAYQKFAEVLTFQPWRSWARRYAEEARDARLGLPNR